MILGEENLKPGDRVDHINGNRLGNRRSNLRVVSQGQNLQNREGKNVNNKSGYRNVFWNTAEGKWCVSVCKDYKRYHGGSFDDVDDAGRAAELLRNQLFGEYAGHG